MNTKYALIAVALLAAYVLFVRGSNPIAQAANDAASSARSGSPAGGIV